MQNYFELFGLTPNFNIDPSQLSEIFRSLQHTAHPDRYASGANFERRAAVAQAATINDAYHVLRDPLRRARYLLSLQGIATREDNNTVMDTDFLQEQIALRENLAEIRDASNPRAALRAIQEILHARHVQLITALTDNFRIGNPDSLRNAVDNIHRLRFFERLGEEADYLAEQYI